MTEAFQPFRTAFRAPKPGSDQRSAIPDNPLIDEDPALRKLIDDLGGQPLNLGIYRVFEARLFNAAEDFVGAAFAAWYTHLAPFACDWMGRIYAVDGSDRRVNGQRTLLLLDPATRDLLRVPASLTDFQNEMLVNEPEVPLEARLWQEWLTGHSNGLRYDDVAGWRVPAFLGGELILENLDVQPAAVYWEISGQLIKQAFKLKPGTHISSIEIT